MLIANGRIASEASDAGTPDCEDKEDSGVIDISLTECFRDGGISGKLCNQGRWNLPKFRPADSYWGNTKFLMADKAPH
ncbi:hypothetical protein C5Y93_13420 [Blastopirellula marina]|uniref:Uncharacterized protein n=1 Tax=Blastopirellula marina TaxID=124 RepID=A0A2S8GLY8_9BACT|nr:hypothetical protein C5Y93_13420 [Blastopirellula marina]